MFNQMQTVEKNIRQSKFELSYIKSTVKLSPPYKKPRCVLLRVLHNIIYC